MSELGIDACHQVGIVDDLLDSNSLFLTGNTDTVYVSGILDLGRDGPTVVEIPPGCGPGTVNDAWFRFVIDMGRPGPDRGEGGKYLIVPAGYTDPIPDGYFVAESPSNINWLILRGLLVDGKPDTARDELPHTDCASIRSLRSTRRRRWSSSPCRARCSTPSTPTTSSSTTSSPPSSNANRSRSSTPRPVACWPRSASRRERRSPPTNA